MGSPPFRCCTCEGRCHLARPLSKPSAPIRRPPRDRCRRPPAAPATASRTARTMHQLFLSESRSPASVARDAPSARSRRNPRKSATSVGTGRSPDCPICDRYPCTPRPISRSPVQFRAVQTPASVRCHRAVRPPGHRHRPELPERAAPLPSMAPGARRCRLSALLGPAAAGRSCQPLRASKGRCAMVGIRAPATKGARPQGARAGGGTGGQGGELESHLRVGQELGSRDAQEGREGAAVGELAAAGLPRERRCEAAQHMGLRYARRLGRGAA